MCHLPLTIFADTRHDGQLPELFDQLRKATEGKIAIAFYGIQGKKSDSDDSAWSFTSSFGFFIVCASETTKGKQLESKFFHAQLIRLCRPRRITCCLLRWCDNIEPLKEKS